MNQPVTSSSRAALGWANLGGYACAEPPTRSLQQAVFEAAHQGGVRVHDTAIDYGRGYAEEGLAAAITNTSVERQSLRIQSKVLRQIIQHQKNAYREAGLWKCPEPYQSWSTAWDWSYEGVTRQAAESRQRLGIDYHDGLSLHDPAEAIREAGLRPADLDQTALAALRDLKDKGQLREIGVGSKEVPVLIHLLDLYPGVFDYFMIMNYNLLDHHQAIEELIPRCQEKKVKLFLAGPYASGLLAGALPSLDGAFYYRPAPPGIVDKASTLARVAEQYGLRSLKEVAVQFVAANPIFQTIVFGGRTPGEVLENLNNLESNSPAEFWKALRELRVGGQAFIHPNAPLPTD